MAAGAAELPVLTTVRSGAVGLIAAVGAVLVAITAPGKRQALIAARALEVVRPTAGAGRAALTARLVTTVVAVLPHETWVLLVSLFGR